MCELTWGQAEEYAMQFLQQSLDFDTRLTNLSWEAIEFHTEDVDVSMFPERLFEALPTIFTVDSADTFDTNGDEWLVNVVFEPFGSDFLFWAVRMTDGHLTKTFHLLKSGQVDEWLG